MNFCVLRHGAPWLGAALLLAGCAQYQYAVVQSALPQNAKREFVAANDSVEVRYDFGGYYGPVKITAYNKLDTPLYIDWKKSSLIVNGVARSYWEDKARIEAKADRDQSVLTVSQQLDIQGTVTRPDAISFLPPAASSTFEFTSLRQGRFDVAPWKHGRREKASTAMGAVSTRAYAFEQHDSPMTYRSYLSFAFSEGAPPAFVFDNAFWVKGVFTTQMAPRSFVKDARGDTFYIPTVTAAGIVIGSVAVFALLGLGLFAVR